MPTGLEPMNVLIKKVIHPPNAMTGLFESQGQLALADGSAKLLSKDSDLTDIGMVVKSHSIQWWGQCRKFKCTRILHGRKGTDQTEQVLTGLTATLAQANNQENKIYLLFTGSDWCPSSISLNKQVLK